MHHLLTTRQCGRQARVHFAGRQKRIITRAAESLKKTTGIAHHGKTGSLDGEEFGVCIGLKQDRFAKPGAVSSIKTVILGADMPSSVFKRCAELALQPTCYGEHFDTVFSAGSWQLREALQGQPVSIDLPVTRLPAHNLALAYHAAQAVAPTSPQALQTVAAEVSLAGRLEAIELSGRTCHADVGHNPASAMFLKAELARRQITPRAIICAMLRDKAHQAVGDVMFSAVAEEPAADDCLCIFVNSEGERGFSAASLQAAMGRPGICAKDMPAAIATALSATRPGDDILVFGSFNATEQLKRITSKANARTRAL